MADYTPTNDFSAKAQLDPTDPNAIILGADYDTEFAAIQTAIATKYDSADLSDQATAETGTDNTVLMTPLRTDQAYDSQIGARGHADFTDSWTYDVAGTTEIFENLTFDDSSFLSLTLTAGKTYAFKAVLHGWEPDRIDFKSGADGRAGLSFDQTPQEVAVMRVATGSGNNQLIADPSTDEVRLDSDSFTENQARPATLVGVIKANASAATTVTIKARKLSGSGTYINESSWIAVLQLD